MVLFFPDNTVLINFAIIDRMDLLAIVTRRGLAIEAVFVTDDSGARRLASAHDIRTADTWDLLDDGACRSGRGSGAALAPFRFRGVDPGRLEHW